jgi:hypothetical protein
MPGCTKILVNTHSEDRVYTMPTVVVNQNELFQMEQAHSEFNSLDECIEAVNLNEEDLFSVAGGATPRPE